MRMLIRGNEAITPNETTKTYYESAK